jgi:hypothetical protein
MTATGNNAELALAQGNTYTFGCNVSVNTMSSGNCTCQVKVIVHR